VQCLYPALRSSRIDINGRLDGAKNDKEGGTADTGTCKFIEDITGKLLMIVYHSY
jgi:hypothetical protein